VYFFLVTTKETITHRNAKVKHCFIDETKNFSAREVALIRTCYAEDKKPFNTSSIGNVGDVPLKRAYSTFLERRQKSKSKKVYSFPK
jgi:hypothetical protein